MGPDVDLVARMPDQKLRLLKVRHGLTLTQNYTHFVGKVISDNISEKLSRYTSQFHARGGHYGMQAGRSLPASSLC